MRCLQLCVVAPLPHPITKLVHPPLHFYPYRYCISSAGARGFFVHYLTGDEWTCADGEEVPAGLASSLEAASAATIEIMLMNVVMSAGTSLIHKRAGRDEMVLSSERTCARASTLVTAMAPKLPELRESFAALSQAVESEFLVDAGKQPVAVDEWVAFLASEPEIIYERVHSHAEVLRDPQALANGYLIDMDLIGIGRAAALITLCRALGDRRPRRATARSRLQTTAPPPAPALAPAPHASRWAGTLHRGWAPHTAGGFARSQR